MTPTDLPPAAAGQSSDSAVVTSAAPPTPQLAAHCSLARSVTILRYYYRYTAATMTGDVDTETPVITDTEKTDKELIAEEEKAAEAEQKAEKEVTEEKPKKVKKEKKPTRKKTHKETNTRHVYKNSRVTKQKTTKKTTTQTKNNAKTTTTINLRRKGRKVVKFPPLHRRNQLAVHAVRKLKLSTTTRMKKKWKKRKEMVMEKILI